MPSFSTQLSIIIAVVSLLSYATLWLTSREYPVHTGIVLITGASSGIGRDAALTLAQQNQPSYTVYAAVRSQKDADEITGLKLDRLKPIIMDVTNSQQVATAVQTITATNEPFLALVNNAGIMTRGIQETMDLSITRNMFEVNVFGLLDVTRQFLPLIRKHQGRIINVGSISGLFATAAFSSYCGTKYAVEAFTDSLRRELLDANVSVSIVDPGIIASKLVSKIDGKTAGHNDLPVPSHLQSVYGKLIDSVNEKQVEVRAKESPPSTTTTPAIIHAITSRYPKTRYIVGPVGDFPALLVTTLFRILPDRIVDVILRYA